VFYGLISTRVALKGLREEIVCGRNLCRIHFCRWM